MVEREVRLVAVWRIICFATISILCGLSCERDGMKDRNF